MAEQFNEGLFIATVKNNLSDSELIKRTLRGLGKEKITPIDVASIEVEVIEKKYISYLYQQIQYNYSVTADIAHGRKVYDNVQVVDTNSHGKTIVRNEKKYSHTEYDWQKFIDKGSVVSTKVVSMHSDESNVLNKINEIAYKKINFDFINQIEHDKGANLDFYKDLLDSDILIHSFLEESKKELEEKIVKSIPGDKTNNINYNSTNEYEACAVHIPIYTVRYKYKDEYFIVIFCDTLDYLEFLSMPIDEELKSNHNAIIKKISLPSLGVVPVLVGFTYFFWNDVNVVPYGIGLVLACGSYLGFKYYLSKRIDEKEFDLLAKEKERRINNKISLLI